MTSTATVKILVIDDDRDDLRLISDLLSEANRTRFVVEQAEDGEAAKAYIKRDRFDILLLDYRLPDLTGLALMDWLKDNHFRIPVVLVTSHGDRRLQTEALDAGFADYLEKGTFSADLLERTCLYAIGLNERRDDSGAGGVGLLIQDLVSLTRESLTAQSNTEKETAALRTVIKEDVGGLHRELTNLREDHRRNQDDILKVLQKTTWDRFKEMLSWVTQNPVAALVIVLVLAGLIVLGVLLFQVLDIEKVRVLKDGLKATSEITQVTHLIG